MATIAALTEHLSRSPAASMRLPAAELALQLDQQAEHLSRMEAFTAAKDQAVAAMNEQLRLEQRAMFDSLLADERRQFLDQMQAEARAAISTNFLPADLQTARADLFVLQPDVRQSLEAAAGIGNLSRAQMLQAFTGIEQPFKEFASSFAASLRPTQEAMSLFIDSLRPTWDASQALADIFQQEQESMRRFAQQQAKLIDDWAKEQRMVERELLAGGLFDQQFNVNYVADILIGRQAPALISRPEPAPLPPPKKQPSHQKSGNSGTPPAQPEQPSGDLLALLADALQSGRTQPGEVIRLVAQVAKLPPVAELQAELSELETLEAAWQRARGRKTPVRFASDHGMSKATLYRRWARLKELRLLLEVWQ